MQSMMLNWGLENSNQTAQKNNNWVQLHSFAQFPSFSYTNTIFSLSLLFLTLFPWSSSEDCFFFFLRKLRTNFILKSWIFLSFLFFFRSAVACLGAMYEKLGRMVGRSYEDTIQILIKSLRNAEVNDLFKNLCQIWWQKVSQLLMFFFFFSLN